MRHVTDPMPRAERGRLGMLARWGGEPRNLRLTDLSPAVRRAILALADADRAAQGKEETK